MSTGGDVIRTVRHAMGMSQRELGALVGEGRWYIAEIEHGRRPLREVRDLARLIGSRMGQAAS
ncbi:helix-turn-helix domain-containing protein [Nocardioides cynanchi]|uniref:helix-turn-helix domain-containing protein n=1 Tax=Nocardioides cynanchi TaxID=2558918 RepID=UPI001244BCFB|nr:helix-turn-helix transcriptional regulator [Nocardioides cynanchi]